MASAYEAYDLSSRSRDGPSRIRTCGRPPWRRHAVVWSRRVPTVRRRSRGCPSVAARRHGGVRRRGPPPASCPNLGRIAGPNRRRRPSPTGSRRPTLSRDRGEPGLVPRGVQGPVGSRRGARRLERRVPAHVAGCLRPASRDRRRGGRPLERVVPRPPRPEDEDLVARGAGRDGIDPEMLPELGDATQSVGSVTSRLRGGQRARPRHGGRDRLRRRDGGDVGAGVFEPGEVRDVVGTAEPVCAASAEPREDPTMLVSVTPTPTPTLGCWRTPGSCPAATCGGGAISSLVEERRNEERGLGDAYDQLSEEASRIPAGATAWCSSPRCRGRWPPSGTARRAVLLRAHARAHAGPHHPRDPRGERVRAPRHPRGDESCGARRPPADDRGRGREGPLWRQIKADVTGLPVRVPVSVETTATGAAILATVGSGVHATVATR